MEGEPVRITGVVKDYHFAGLQNIIEPLALSRFSDDCRYLTLKVDTYNLEETLSFIKNKYKSLFPNRYFEYFFLDDDFNRQYIKEEQISSIFNIFTVLGIGIACLGLFGLASYMAQQRTKEIGVRKVLGASINNIILMLSSEFMKWVLISNILAWPLAYLAIHRMFQDFAYRTNIGPFPFLVATGLSLLIAAVTVSYQSIRAARAEPVNSLRYE
jgi:putative ABC transport system permease protein